MKLHNGQRGARVWGRDGGGGGSSSATVKHGQGFRLSQGESLRVRPHSPTLTSRLTSPYEATSATRAQ